MREMSALDVPRALGGHGGSGPTPCASGGIDL